jgi:hypothetical protein
MPFLGGTGKLAPDPRATASQPLEGVTEWTCPRNGVHVVEVHYTADPAKRDPQWLREAQRGMPPRGWQREMEIVWDLPAGTPVYPEYVPAEMRRAVPVHPAARLLRFWDFGHVCPVTLFAQLDTWGRLAVLAELVLEYAALGTQIDAVRAMTLDLMGGAPTACFDAGDPEAKHEMELGSIRRVLLDAGILLQTYGGRGGGSYDNLRQRMLRRVHVPGEERPSPMLLVSPACPILHSALAGGFSRHPRTGKPLETHPYKDVCDALRYGNDNLLGASAEWLTKLKAIAKADCAW